MIFTILGIFLYFSEFSMILFSIFNSKKINKKIKKMGAGPADVTRLMPGSRGSCYNTGRSPND